MKKALITGVTGQDGSYLAEFLLTKGYEVHGVVRRTSSLNRERLNRIYHDLKSRNKDFYLHYGDMNDSSSLITILAQVRPDEIYNLAAQSHVKISFEIPEYTANSDALGVLRLLEAMMKLELKNTKLYQASTSELYGLAQEIPQKETTPFYPRSPYGVAKLYAYWIIVNYREAYNIFACNGILFNHECLKYDTPLLIEYGEGIDIVPVCDIVPHRSSNHSGKQITDISYRNLKVWDGNNFVKVSLTSARPIRNENLKIIQTKSSLYEVTGNHKVFLESNPHALEIEASKVKINEKLLVSNIFPTYDHVAVTKEFAYFLGLMAGDGFIDENGYNIRFTNKKLELIEEIRDLWKKITGKTIFKLNSQTTEYNSLVYRLDLIYKNSFGKYLRDLLYCRRIKSKKVPTLILNSSREIKLEFLRGYNKADGTISKSTKVKYEFVRFKSKDIVLLQGLLYLIQQTTRQKVRVFLEKRENTYYYGLDLLTPISKKSIEDRNKVILIEDNPPNYGYVFDLETESGKLMAGLGNAIIHNSERRGENFVSKKITQGVAAIKLGSNDKIYLGNLNSSRDWGHAKDYVEAMWLMLQQEKPEDLVIATGESHTIREFAELAFQQVGIKIRWKGSGLDEKGFDEATGKVHIEVDPIYFRPSEVDSLQGDPSKARAKLGWEPKIKFPELVKIMVEHDLKELRLKKITEEINKLDK